jgi:hypothetical protein
MRRARIVCGASFSPNKAYGEGALIGDELNADEIILNCYRLADRFHQSPEVFIAMPVSRINEHIRYTVKLIEAQNKARKRDND